MPRLSETHQFLQSSWFWEARHALIGQLSSALWLAEYLKCEIEMLLCEMFTLFSELLLDINIIYYFAYC